MISRVITDQYPLFLPPPRTPRSKGLHISGIIRCIATEAGILKPEWAEELSLVDVRRITDPVSILRINIGLAWEQHYIPTFLHDVVDHPDEMELDGIYMTKDGESVSSVIITPMDNLQIMVHEVKATYKSTKTVGDLENEWMWLAQLKSYCKGTGTRFARMHVLFLCGNYKFPIKPVRTVWEVEFTQQEVDDNWNLMTGYRDNYVTS